MKKTVLFSLLALTATLCADGEVIADANMMKDQPKKQPQTQMNNQSLMNVVTLTSARPESKNGWYLFADALYWKADIGSTDWANVNDTSDPTKTEAHNHSLNFKWDWGFRAGIGANIDHDMWDSNFYYTWFFTDQSNSAGKPNSIVVDQIGIDAVNLGRPLTTGSIKWNVHFSMFDWELGRWHYVSKNLALRPHVGVKGGWINQSIHSEFGNPVAPSISLKEKFENNYWGVGPSVGINTTWVLGTSGKEMDNRFSLFGDFGGALMYGHFEIDNKQETRTTTGLQIQGLNQKGLDRNLATAMLQGILGFSWDTAFNRDRCHFMFKVGYELQYWFRQNQLIRSFVSPTGSLAARNQRLSDDLSLQGITAEVRFDF
ncbi:MAG: Lpg1974 family pore-forming outer membrane protein [Rhabdochlamydiaceae bacterium]|jgi:hypothetical protein